MLKRRIGLTALIICALLFISFLAWQYVFQIYEVKAELSAHNIKCNANENIELLAYPVNSFGKKIPFRSVEVEIDFESNENLVEAIVLNNSKIKAIFKPIGKCGTVNVIVRCKYSFSPIRLSFNIVD